MGPVFSTEGERSAIILYAVAARDFEDFMDMAGESSPEAIRILKEMCAIVDPDPDPLVDKELNKLMLSYLNRKFPDVSGDLPAEEKKTAFDHILEDD